MATVIAFDVTAWVTYFVLLFGTVYFLTHSSVFTLPRVVIASTGTWFEIFSYCAACTGTWVGLVLGVAHRWPIDSGWASVPISGLAGMVFGLWWGAKQREWSGYSAHVNEAPLVKSIRDQRYAAKVSLTTAEVQKSVDAFGDLLEENRKARDAAQAEPEAEG